MAGRQRYFDKFWHGWLKRPYRLHCAYDSGDTDDNVTVVLLHGLGRSADVWQHIYGRLQDVPCRVVALDLLGFGRSPKPESVRYDADDHALAVIHTLKKLRVGGPVILVGHSMGCLISVRAARLRPQLARHLVLYEMPLYSGLPDKRQYRLRLKLYFRIYERVISFRPIFSGPGKGRAQRLAEKLAGFTLTDDTWKPFIRSLKHTIMEQTTGDDLKHIAAPIDVIYGTRDRLVIRGETKLIFGEDAANVTAHTIREGHTISDKACQFIAGRIRAAVLGRTQQEIDDGRPLPESSRPVKMPPVKRPRRRRGV